MDLLKRNLEAYLARQNRSLVEFFNEFNITRLEDISLGDFRLFCIENNLDYATVLSRPMYAERDKLKNIKLLILDVDGVMTDGGMLFTEHGDQAKKYNTKDGMAIRALDQYGIQAGIISSGFKLKMVKDRADMLKIQHVYVGREPKIKILKNWCEALRIELEEVAMIGDDINDLPLMHKVGYSACPSDAVLKVKETVDLVLQTAGGKGCIREFIDFHLLEEPVS